MTRNRPSRPLLVPTNHGRKPCRCCGEWVYTVQADGRGPAFFPSSCLNCGADPEDDYTVLGHCPHGVDLDRAFCPQGCRV